MRRLYTLVSHLPVDSMLVQLNKNEDGTVHFNRQSQPQQPRVNGGKAVASLSGVDPRQFYSGELTWK